MMTTSSGHKVLPDIPEKTLKSYLSQKEIAVDTELEGLRLVRDQVALVQLCDRNQEVCLVRPDISNPPPNLTRFFTHPKTIKIFHYAISDVAFLKSSLGIDVHPFRCTKVMSKLIRTYTDSHGLKHLVKEFIGLEMDKNAQSSNWQRKDLTQEQLQYAANDVLYLLPVYDALKRMLKERGKLPTGISAVEINDHSQKMLITMVELVLNGYGDRNQGWETSLFSH